jgi:hypothetical protein
LRSNLPHQNIDQALALCDGLSTSSKKGTPMKLLHLARKACGLLLVMAAVASPVFGQVAPTPEIDPGSAVSALALLSCGYFLIADRFRRK